MKRVVKQTLILLNGISEFVSNTVGVSATTLLETLVLSLLRTWTWKKHVNTVCRSAYFQLQNIGRKRKFLTTDATKDVGEFFGDLKTALL